VPRASSDRDFSEAATASDADPSPLRRLILAQEEEPGGPAVALFTDATLHGEPAGSAHVEHVDPGDVDLFSHDAYVLQSALGEHLLGGPGLPVRPAPTTAPAGTWDAARSRALAAAPVVAVNYHEIDEANWPAVQERLRRLRDLGDDVDLDTPDDQVTGPRVVVGLYDAYREPALRGAELCERLGLRAWIFPVFEQHDEPGAAELRDDELADLARRHELGFHTAGHVRCDEVDAQSVRHQVVDVVERLTALAGRPPRLGAWRGGTRFDETLLGDRTLRDLGVRHLISNWSVERVPGSGAQERTTGPD
jgi:hypothetical protein